MARWSVRIRWVLVAVVVAVAAAACGSDDDGAADAATSDEPATEAAGDEADSEADNAVPVGEAPEIDPAAMPPPGEAIVEVDGQTFVFRQSDMLDSPFACEVRDDGFTINFQSDRHDMLLQGAVQADGTILASTTVVPEESDFRYSSTNGGGNGGGATAQGQQVLFVSRFDATPKDDLASFADVGQGSVAVTCP